MRKGIIEIEDMEFYSFHGCFETERIVGNRFLVNLVLETDIEQAANEDNIKKSVNYLSVYEVVKAQMATPSAILENVAKRILDAVFSQFTSVDYAKVKVSKMAPPLGGNVERVSVTMDMLSTNNQ